MLKVNGSGPLKRTAAVLHTRLPLFDCNCRKRPNRKIDQPEIYMAAGVNRAELERRIIEHFISVINA
ncbi:MAG: hypothetical protein R2860_02710 [Desulfobacterales bacterium]